MPTATTEATIEAGRVRRNWLLAAPARLLLIGASGLLLIVWSTRSSSPASIQSGLRPRPVEIFSKRDIFDGTLGRRHAPDDLLALGAPVALTTLITILLGFPPLVHRHRPKSQRASALLITIRSGPTS